MLPNEARHGRVLSATQSRCPPGDLTSGTFISVIVILTSCIYNEAVICNETDHILRSRGMIGSFGQGISALVGRGISQPPFAGQIMAPLYQEHLGLTGPRLGPAGLPGGGKSAFVC